MARWRIACYVMRAEGLRERCLILPAPWNRAPASGTCGLGPDGGAGCPLVTAAAPAPLIGEAHGLLAAPVPLPLPYDSDVRAVLRLEVPDSPRLRCQGCLGPLLAMPGILARVPLALHGAGAA